MQSYHDVRGSVMNARGQRDTFVQLIGEHAVFIEDLLHADRMENKRALMTSWVNISRLNDEWLTLMCPVHHYSNQEFRTVSEKLVNMYSEVLGDFILDTHLGKEKVEEIAKLEAEFYATLVDVQLKETTKKHWIDYTKSIGMMVFARDMYGAKSRPFYEAAANCIHSGKLLGHCLDRAIFK